MTNEQLFEYAKEARIKACVELTNFKVGAALLTMSGEVILGCNIEDPSGIGVTNICAERCAIVKALSDGHTDFKKIAVAGGPDELMFCAPCGACRQYLNSWCPDIKVILPEDTASRGDACNKLKEYSMSELLPYSFDETF